MHLHAFPSICKHLQVFESICMHLHACTNIYKHLQAFESICKHLHALARIYKHLQLFTRMCMHLQAFGSMYKESAGVCTHLRAFEKDLRAFASICKHLPASTGIYQHLRSLSSICWHLSRVCDDLFLMLVLSVFDFLHIFLGHIVMHLSFPDLFLVLLNDCFMNMYFFRCAFAIFLHCGLLHSSFPVLILVLHIDFFMWIECLPVTMRCRDSAHIVWFAMIYFSSLC